MNSFNEILKNYRNKNYNSVNFIYTKDVLNQLLVIAFNNLDTPDELPNTFILKDIHFTTSEIQNLLMDIGFQVKAQMIFRDYTSRVATFKITITKKLFD